MPDQMVTLNAVNTIAAGLERLGEPVPAGTAAALATYNAATAAVFGADAPVDLDGLVANATAENVAALVHDLGMRSLERDAVKRGAGPDIVARLGRRLARAVKADGPAVLDTLGPHFTKAAAVFAKAVDQLPAGNVDPAALVAAGPKVVAAFGTAGEAHATMTTAATVRNTLAGMGVVAGSGDLELATRYAKVADVESGELATNAMRTTGPLAPFLALLAVPGAEVAWQSIDEQRAHISGLRRPVAA